MLSQANDQKHVAVGHSGPDVVKAHGWSEFDRCASKSPARISLKFCLEEKWYDGDGGYDA